MSDFGLSEGATVARTCAGCDVTVTILAPERNGHGSDEEAWNRWRNLIRAQIAWPLMCPVCKRWWNGQLQATKRTEVAA